MLGYTTTTSTSTPQETLSTCQPTGGCAILLFGLPRSFRQYVLPSLEQSVVRPNARYRCDYYVHYYQQSREAAGRSGRGGTIRADDILELDDVVRRVHDEYHHHHHSHTTDTTDHNHNSHNSHTSTDTYIPAPTVTFVSDTNATFWKQREGTLRRYQTATNADGNYTFFPWKSETYVYPTTLDNIVRQWHSIQAVWDAMEEAAPSFSTSTPQYRRVAVLRNDVIYLTPIDIYGVPSSLSSSVSTHVVSDSDSDSDKKSPMPLPLPLTVSPCDDENIDGISVIPKFARFPVNDRLIYGPYDAVKIWASERFERVEAFAQQTVHHPTLKGMTMHSETFMNYGLLSAIHGRPVVDNSGDSNNHVNKKFHHRVLQDPTICFLRVRADGAIWTEDCESYRSHGDPNDANGSEATGSKAQASEGYPGGRDQYLPLLWPWVPPGHVCQEDSIGSRLTSTSSTSESSSSSSSTSSSSSPLKDILELTCCPPWRCGHPLSRRSRNRHWTLTLTLWAVGLLGLVVVRRPTPPLDNKME